MSYLRYFPIFVAMLLIVPIGLGQEAADVRHAQPPLFGVVAHNDTVQRILMENVDIGTRLSDGQVDIPRLQEGGVNVPFFALWVPSYYKGSEAVRRTMDLRDAMQHVFDKYPDRIALAVSARDIERIVGQHKIAVVLTIEGGHQIDNDLAVLRMYRRMGILSMTLTHTHNNNWADSSTDTPEHDGLTSFGNEVVREMNRIGMIIDVSHVSDKTFYDVLRVSTKPVIASHSSCRSISDIPRNMSDDMLRALARNGGVAGVSFGPSFLNQKNADEFKQQMPHYNAIDPNLTGTELDKFAVKQEVENSQDRPRVNYATITDVADCIDHMVNVAGIEHVGIGSDFDGVGLALPRGLEDVSKMPALTAVLLKRGYAESDIQKIMGTNFLRVVREVVEQVPSPQQ